MLGHADSLLQEETKDSLRKRRKRKSGSDADPLAEPDTPANERKSKKKVSFG